MRKNNLSSKNKKYYEYAGKMAAPIMPSELPKRRINFSAIAQYAKKNGICVADLSAEEKEKLIQTVGSR